MNELVPSKQPLEGVALPSTDSPESFIQKLKSDPIRTVTEIAIGVGFSPKKDLAKTAANILLAAREAQLIKKLFEEFEYFQTQGKLGRDEELVSKPNFMKTLVDIMEAIDRNPEDTQFETIKNMYFLYLSADKYEKDVALTYTLLQKIIALSSSELLTLMTAYNLLKESRSSGSNFQELQSAEVWLKEVANKAGHGLAAAIEVDEIKLMELMLLSGRKYNDRSGVNLKDYRLTDLGIALCEHLEFGDSIFSSRE